MLGETKFLTVFGGQSHSLEVQNTISGLAAGQAAHIEDHGREA